jgi:heptose I phosphotransferase
LSSWPVPTNPYLRDDFAARWQCRDAFAELEALRGTVYRQVAGRTTFRFELDGCGYFAKVHQGVGWREIVKNLLTLRRPVVDASNEFGAAMLLTRLGLDTLNVAAFGARGWNPATRRSFLVSDEIRDACSLEDYCLRWPERPPPPNLKRALVTKVADVARVMHDGGTNHRDLYLCHLLIADPQALTPDNVAHARLYVIDLHRAQQRRRVPYRWLVRDLGALYYSAIDIGLTRRDVLRFLSGYFQQPVRDVLADHAKLLHAAARRARKLYIKAERLGILPRQVAGRA